MPELTLTEEQVAAYAEAMGVEPEDVTPETLAAYHEEQAATLAEIEEQARSFSESEVMQRVEAAEKDAKAANERAEKAERRFYEDERDALIDQAIADYKIEPGKREDWIARYDESPELTKTFIEELRPDQNLVRNFGSDDRGGGSEEEERVYQAMTQAFGIEYEAPGGDK